MSVLGGCHDARNMTCIKEVECPKCKEIVEVFERDGHMVGNNACENCGYIFSDEIASDAASNSVNQKTED